LKEENAKWYITLCVKPIARSRVRKFTEKLQRRKTDFSERGLTLKGLKWETNL